MHARGLGSQAEAISRALDIAERWDMSDDCGRVLAKLSMSNDDMLDIITSALESINGGSALFRILAASPGLKLNDHEYAALAILPRADGDERLAGEILTAFWNARANEKAKA